MKNKDYIFAIDLGSSDIVVVAGHEGASGGLAVEAVSIQPSAGLANGEVKNVAEAAAAVKRAVDDVEKQLGVAVRDAFIGISGSHIRSIKHPYYVYVSGNDGEIIDQDVASLNESMRHVQVSDGYVLLHTIPQHYLIDDVEEAVNPVGMFGRTLGSVFNLVVGNSVTTSRTAKALERIGLRSGGMFVNPVAVADAVTTQDEREIGVAVVDIGAGTTDVCIYQRGVVRYIGVIPLGAEAINKDIRSYGIMDRYVEELKTKWGCAIPDAIEENKLVWTPGRVPGETRDISLQNLASIIQARLLDVLDYVNEEIASSGYGDKLDAGVVVTGGGAMIREIAPLMAKHMDRDVRVGTPDAMVESGDAEKVTDPRVSAAIGLLLMALRQDGRALKAPTDKNLRDAASRQPDPQPEPVRKEETPHEWEKQPVSYDGEEEEDFSPRPKKNKGGFKSFFRKMGDGVKRIAQMDPLEEEDEDDDLM